MLITVERLQYLVEAAEAGSFSAAARKLGCNAWTVNQVIQHMETDLGVVLFERSAGKAPKLTMEGKNFYLQALEIMPRLEAMEGKARSLQQGVEDTINIAVHALAFTPRIRQAIVELGQTYPDLTVHLLEAGEHKERVGTGVDISIAPTTLDMARGQEWAQIDNIRWLCVAASSHPLTRVRGEIEPADLTRHIQLVLSQGKVFSGELMDSARVSPRQLYCDRFYQFQAMLLDGAGFAWMPEVLAQPWIERGELKLLNVSYAQADMLWGIEMIWTQNIGPAGRRLVDELLETASDI